MILVLKELKTLLKPDFQTFVYTTFKSLKTAFSKSLSDQITEIQAIFATFRDFSRLLAIFEKDWKNKLKLVFSTKCS